MELIDSNDRRFDAHNAKAWPFEEARKILTRINNKVPEKGYVLLETGYGASGLPHIGTFGEVLRTTMVRHAFSVLSDIPTKLFCISDDMDALRKVPENVPNQAMLAQYLGKPLTTIPDPFEKYPSFGEHNNAKLKEFLDSFGFEYTFISSTECYKAGTYDPMLKRILENYDQIMKIMIPTLGEERQKTYSPFLPICKRTGNVLQVPMVRINLAHNSIVYRDEVTNEEVEVPVTGGHCKLQWKVDWPMRWAAFGVDYEMSGKDLIDSVTIGQKISKVIDNQPPAGMITELFLDQSGQKISKSKGNGISLEDWLCFAPEESLAYYMYQNPKRAKKLYFDVIPKATDEYLGQLENYLLQTHVEQIENPVFHIHNGHPPKPNTSHISFLILLNLASICNADNKEILWKFVKRYDKNANPEDMPLLDKLIVCAIKYYKKFIVKSFRKPSEEEASALRDLLAFLESVPGDMLSTEIQHQIYEIGKKHKFSNLRDWFLCLYEVLLGQKEGPRMGSFIALYGVDNMCGLIREKMGE